MLLDLCISLNRLASFKNKTSMFLIIKKENFTCVFMFIFIGSILIISICYLIPRKVNQFAWLIHLNDNKTNETTVTTIALYQVTSNSIGQNEIMVIFLLIINILRGVVLVVFLFILNLIISFKYHGHLKRKQLKFSNITSKILLSEIFRVYKLDISKHQIYCNSSFN